MLGPDLRAISRLKKGFKSIGATGSNQDVRIH